MLERVTPPLHSAGTALLRAEPPNLAGPEGACSCGSGVHAGSAGDPRPEHGILFPAHGLLPSTHGVLLPALRVQFHAKSLLSPRPRARRPAHRVHSRVHRAAVRRTGFTSACTGPADRPQDTRAASQGTPAPAQGPTSSA